jgi:hypothetical protein
MLSKPKCVVFSLLRLGFCSARYGEDEKARTDTGVAARVESRNRFAARGTNEDMVDVFDCVLASQAHQAMRQTLASMCQDASKDRRLDPAGRSFAGRIPPDGARGRAAEGPSFAEGVGSHHCTSQVPCLCCIGVFLLEKSQHESSQIYIACGSSPIKTFSSKCDQKMELCITTARIRSVYRCLSFLPLMYTKMWSECVFLVL